MKKKQLKSLENDYRRVESAFNALEDATPRNFVSWKRRDVEVVLKRARALQDRADILVAQASMLVAVCEGEIVEAKNKKEADGAGEQNSHKRKNKAA